MKSRPRFFLPNRLSFFRLLLGFLIPALLFLPAKWLFLGKPWNFWLAFLLFIVGALTDFWDGWLARRHRLETALGRVLDPTADKIFILGIMGSFAAQGVYSHWYFIPILLRELGVTVCRLIWLQSGEAVGAEKAGKLKLGSHVASVLASFLYLTIPSSVTQVLNQILMQAAVVLTLYSGFFFFKHNFARMNTPKFARAIASLGVGNLPLFPGTYGSLLGLLVVPLISWNLPFYVLIFLFFSALGLVAISGIGLKPKDDPLEVVIDEFCGVLLAFFAVPLSGSSLVVGFLLFRFFDVTKIFPIRWLENRHGAWGILLDDLGAGVYTWVLLKLIFSQ